MNTTTVHPAPSAMLADAYSKIVSLLRDNRISHRIVYHDPEGNTDLASQLRNHPLPQAAKSIVVALKYATGQVSHCLAVVPGDRRVSLEALAKLKGARKAYMAERKTAEALSGCQSGSIPPLNLENSLPILVDSCFAQYGDDLIYFNAGRLDVSVGVPCSDYLGLIGADKLASISDQTVEG